MPMKGEHGAQDIGPGLSLADMVEKLQGVGHPKVPLPAKKLKANWWNCLFELALFLGVNGMTFRRRWLYDPYGAGGKTIYLFSCDQRKLSFVHQADERFLHVFGDRRAASELRRLVTAWRKTKYPGLEDYVFESCERTPKSGWFLERRGITFKVSASPRPKA